MPIHDAPAWKLDERAVAHVVQHAPFVREHIAGIIQGLEESGVGWHDAQSFGAEVAAALVNLLADRLTERGNEVFPTNDVSHSALLGVMVKDITTRALLRKLRGDD